MLANDNVVFEKKKLNKEMLMIKNFVKLEIIVIIHVNTEVIHITCNLRSSIRKEIPVISHNRSNYD